MGPGSWSFQNSSHLGRRRFLSLPLHGVSQCNKWVHRWQDSVMLGQPQLVQSNAMLLTGAMMKPVVNYWWDGGPWAGGGGVVWRGEGSTAWDGGPWRGGEGGGGNASAEVLYARLPRCVKLCTEEWTLVCLLILQNVCFIKKANEHPRHQLSLCIHTHRHRHALLTVLEKLPWWASYVLGKLWLTSQIGLCYSIWSSSKG